MKRCIASVSILSALILLCVISLFELHTQCRDYVAMTDAVATAIEQGDRYQALLALDTLEQGWKHYHDITGIFVNGSELDSIRETLSGLRPMLEDSRPEIKTELEKMRVLILSVYEEELPELWHIL